ncbi:PLP-dependent aminotransferase family protein [Actinophytocola oryzae]|uniref:GntR family transcriptional regulator n=1 Tax=Actinophytocola oryzae TaxID=502181 RepID=A0A4R7W1A4_9PSEU|nr:PLP-dependent aminotransferase family protein [Actinophytocola oryzae]TDV56316.1 GntR family transcriptional regulator [Actinophytocola oryzae]
MRIPSYKPVVDDLAAAIRAGTLTPGTRLPTHRALARQRGIALATATRAYAELEAAGLVVGEPGRGTFVRDRSGFDGPEPSRVLAVPRTADLSFNQPTSPGEADGLRQALRDLAGAGDAEALLRQSPPAGRTADRAAVATHLLDRGLDVPPAQVVLTGGAQHALDTILRCTTRPGDVVAVDALTYPGLKLVAGVQGLDLAPVPVTPSGPDLEALDRLCRDRPVRAAYVIPTLHNPLGWVLDHEQRERLAHIARTRDLLLVEDGTYAYLDPDAPPPLQTYAPERTCYLASLSKNVAAGLRFGFAVLPPHRVDAARTVLRASTWGLPTIVTTLVRGWLADGTVARRERERRVDAAARQTIARQELAGLDVTAHPVSYSCWVRLAPHLHTAAVAAALADAGILVATAAAFSTTPHPPRALRIALGGTARAELAPALRGLRQVLDGFPP